MAREREERTCVFCGKVFVVQLGADVHQPGVTFYDPRCGVEWQACGYRCYRDHWRERATAVMAVSGKAMTREEYRKRLTAYQDARENDTTTLGELRKLHAALEHEHVFKKAEFSEGAICTLCDYLAGEWYCPESPDHLCHYDEGDLDQCDFCGEPEERK